MQNFSNNQGNSKQEKDKQRKDVQREIIMTESEKQKYLKEKNMLEGEIRSLKKEEARIRVDLQEKQTRLEKVDYELAQIEAAIKNLKKKLNNLT